MADLACENLDCDDDHFQHLRLCIMSKHKYVCGFLFQDKLHTVVLIQKVKPEWQAGLLNGVGGKIEPGESAHEAMTREFCEETGLNVPANLWNEFATINFDGTPVTFFRAFDPENVFGVARAITNEVPGNYNATAIQFSDTVIPNLKWLVPMALYDLSCFSIKAKKL